MSELRHDTITFLSDFGRADHFVGVVHSVLRQMAPGVSVVDLTHEIAPFDVRGGSLALARAVQYVSPGVIMAVVDPGVGSTRRAVAIEAAEGRAVFVGPDNGLLASAIGLIGGAETAVVLDDPAYHLPTGASTFDGRDIFAPVAAHLCLGVPITDLGTAIEPGALTPGLIPLTRDEGGRVVGEVIWVDRFGNVQLNVDPDEIAGFGEVVSVTFGDAERVAHPVSSFSELGPGGLGALVDSDGLVALVIDQASAAEMLGLAVGDEVSLGPVDDGESAPRADVVTEVDGPRRRSADSGR